MVEESPYPFYSPAVMRGAGGYVEVGGEVVRGAGRAQRRSVQNVSPADVPHFLSEKTMQDIARLNPRMAQVLASKDTAPIISVTTIEDAPVLTRQERLSNYAPALERRVVYDSPQVFRASERAGSVHRQMLVDNSSIPLPRPRVSIHRPLSPAVITRPYIPIIPDHLPFSSYELHNNQLVERVQASPMRAQRLNSVTSYSRGASPLVARHSPAFQTSGARPTNPYFDRFVSSERGLPASFTEDGAVNIGPDEICVEVKQPRLVKTYIDAPVAAKTLII